MTTLPPEVSKLGHNVMLGIGFKIASVTLFIVMNSLVKSTKNIPVGELLFFRSLFAILPITIMLAFRGELRQSLHTNQLPSHLLRGMLSVGAITLMFLAVLNLPLPDATAISYATPLIIVVLGALIFKEDVRLFRGTAVFVGFIGVIIIIWPNLSFGLHAFNLEGGRSFGIMVALAGAVMASLAQVTIRKLVRTESSSTIVLYVSITATCFALLSAPFGWIMPTSTQIMVLVSIGIIGGIAQICMTESYRHADMSIVAPFEYSSLILSVLIGYFIFAEPPSVHTILGGLLVVSAGIAIILRERYLGLERAAAARKASTPHG